MEWLILTALALIIVIESISLYRNQITLQGNIATLRDEIANIKEARDYHKKQAELWRMRSNEMAGLLENKGQITAYVVSDRGVEMLPPDWRNQFAGMKDDVDA